MTQSADQSQTTVPTWRDRVAFLRALANEPGREPWQRGALRSAAARLEADWSPPPNPTRPPDYYTLTPGWEHRKGDPGEPGMATAAVLTCAATGRVLAGMGGGALAIHPSVIGRPGGSANE